nr:Monothiol glutaredoxin-S17 like [Ipomoea trifida]
MTSGLRPTLEVDIGGPCSLPGPLTSSSELPSLLAPQVEAEEQPEISEAYSVSAVPYFVFFKNGLDTKVEKSDSSVQKQIKDN